MPDRVDHITADLDVAIVRLERMRATAEQEAAAIVATETADGEPLLEALRARALHEGTARGLTIALRYLRRLGADHGLDLEPAPSAVGSASRPDDARSDAA